MSKPQTPAPKKPKNPSVKKKSDIDKALKDVKAKPITSKEAQEKSDAIQDKVGEVKLYGGGAKYEAYSFDVQTVAYNDAKGYEFKLNILFALDDIDREYTLFFHQMDFGLFKGSEFPDLPEKLMNVFVSKCENKTGKTILTFVPTEPMDCHRVMSRVVGVKNYKILLIPKGVMHKFDYDKARALVHNWN